MNDEELKTLKDIDKNLNYSLDASENVWLYRDELKKEAIKWYKEYYHPEEGDTCDIVILFFIRKFFNLSDEDLK